MVPQTESDEYVQIRNGGTSVVNLFGWTLLDVSDNAPIFDFPVYEMAPDATARVYTNENHPESGGFSFDRSIAVWDNENPDRAALIDPNGVTVFQKTYPPGC